MSERQVKDVLYAQVARIGKAVCSPKRLELIDLLAQGEKSVEQLASEAGISQKLASAHLRELRLANLVEARREGKNVYYRLSGKTVADFWVALRSLAEDRLLELRAALSKLSESIHELTPMSREEILELARRGEVVVLDVRPETEFAAGHLPYAHSMPLSQVQKRLAELPRDRPVVAYCRGPFCLMAKEAAELLNKEGFRALRLEDGVAEWRARGLPVETGE
ncbi:ArsR/SmtB family transcription factor [Thioalkalivibrio thiocyanodenitrificans]|uniref:ArsR/SmtB family transcription factor n=1 Tax=Thioalkalivibrio thiocyanodenitrificans TaxID=243063 RepID=UPI000476EDEA|nr:metalloregulator ArsR/SmtB family transcription factor [Thioalkalivibrio thiocyanodenitrificans]